MTGSLPATVKLQTSSVSSALAIFSRVGLSSRTFGRWPVSNGELRRETPLGKSQPFERGEKTEFVTEPLFLA